MISDDRTEKAVEYIRDNAKLVGRLKGQKLMLEHVMKVIKAQIFLRSDGTVAERQAIAEAHPEYISKITEYENCVTELETVQTYIKSADLTVAVWQTQSANNRRGNI